MKDNNEITVRILCTKAEMIRLLQTQGFSLEREFSMDDAYYVPEDTDLTQPARDVIAKTLILRRIMACDPDRIQKDGRSAEPEPWADQKREQVQNQNRDQNRDQDREVRLLVRKEKVIAPDGTIISQKNDSRSVEDMARAASELESRGFRLLMEIHEDSLVYARDGFSLAVKDVRDDVLLTEVETQEEPPYDNIPAVIRAFEGLGIPYDRSDYYVKKAERAFARL